MSEASPASSRRGFRWAWVRHAVQVLALALFAAPVLAAGWSLLGLSVGGEEPAATPAQLPFFGSLSSSSVAGVNVLDPFGMLQVAAASKTFEVDWLLAALPVLIVYGLIRGRAFCGWVCPVNLLMEIVDAVRRKLRIEVREMPVPRHAKLWIALAVLALSALTSVPVFEAFSPISAINKGILFGAVTGLWVLAAIVAVELFWGHRVWCRSLCPLGGFYEALGRVGQVNVKLDRDACIHCDACKRSCLSDPAILDPVLTERDVIVRAGDCMACGSCIDACPTRALSFTLGRVGK
ncbi:4Fe-4S binding protein [Eggerthella sinensis]|uniref:4Fe-4S ferredoxin n=1 Tax=Eggerthella sinensis TaxID=242230 RepID=A0A3N0IST4_9ACTN|nr:4Fe-4S binding protein [Eggerthella sinensis]RDB66093.1 4Fe-4S ferredoxin [Eggerthella sinensis]RNM40045.1 4Fe-4S ferredoxin [Eggerthella sinensis]